jgi:hypothetical protein
MFAGLAVIAFCLMGALVWRASWISHRLLRYWAATTIRDNSGGVYRLDVGTIRFNFALRRISVDSMRVTTNNVVNSARTRPLATLGLVFHDCTISGVHLATLVRSRGLVASSLGCEVVSAQFIVPPGIADTAPGRAHNNTLLSLQQGVALPSFAPRIEIASIAFPDVALDFRLQRAKGGSSRIQLERFRWAMTGFDLNQSDSTSALRPIFSRSIDMSADNLTYHPDSSTTLKVASLVASLTDSTLDARGVSFAPMLGRAAYAREKSYRRKYATTSVAAISIRGADVSALLLGRGLRARSLTVDSLILDVTNDLRLPAKPGGKVIRRTPQQWIANLDRPIAVDSVFLRRSTVVYRFRNVGRADFGVMTFGRLSARALDMNTGRVGASPVAPLRLSISTMLQDSAQLDAQFVVPLRAPRFDMTYHGTLGPMRADVLNSFVEATTPVRIVRGDVTGVAFRASVSNGLALGTVTPLYSDFTFAVNQEGSKGLISRNGFFAGVARTMASFSVNWQRINGWNPDDPRNKPRVGRIRHAFSSGESLPAYLWIGLRDGMGTVLRK